MKHLIYILVIYSVVQAKEMYTTKWDNINVEEILKSDRLLTNYNKCLLEQGSCTLEGAELKRNLPDALKTECSKCSQKQKENTEKIIQFLIDEKPEMWSVLQNKYDPEQIYYTKYMASKTEAEEEES